MLKLSESKRAFIVTSQDTRNIMMLIFAFFISRAELFGTVSTFSPSFLAMFIGDGIFFYVMAVVSALGLITKAGGWNLNIGKYLICIGILCVVNAFVKKPVKARRHICITFAMALSGLLTTVLSGFTIYYSVLALLESLLVFAFSIVISKGMGVLGVKRIRSRNGLGNEELISLGLIFSAVAAGMGGVNIGNMPIQMFFCFVLAFILAYKGGAALGAAMGALMGLILVMAGGVDAAFMAALTVSAMAMGFLKDLGKLLSVCGFMISGLIILFYFNSQGSVYSAGLYGVVRPGIAYAFFLAALAFMLLPRNFFNKFSFYVSMEKPLEETDYFRRVRELTTDKLENIANSFGKLAKTLDMLSEHKSALTQNDVSQIIDNTVSKVCIDCGMCHSCWEENFFGSFQASFAILSACDKKGKVSLEDIPAAFYGNCISLQRFIDAVNRTYEVYKNNLVWNNRIIESRRLVAQQLDCVAEIIKDTAGELGIELSFKEDLEELLTQELEKIGVEVKDMIVLESKAGKYEVFLNHNQCYGKRSCIKDIIPAISRALGRKMSAADTSCRIKNSGTDCRLKVIEQQRFKVTSGIARNAKDNSAISGDSYSLMELKDGVCMLALSDGMGTGRKAHEESAASIELLEQFVESGFKKESAIRMINSVLILKSSEESFSTLDICSIDLYSGVCEFVKTGAAATYLLRDLELSVVRSKSLPVGIIDNLEVETTVKRLKDGDIIIMVTDGVDEAGEPVGAGELNWIGGALAEFKSNNPQDLAEYILQKARKLSGGSAKDDMTVLVARVWEKY